MRTKRVVLAAVLGVFAAGVGGCGLCDCCGGSGEGPTLPRSSGAFPAQPPAIGAGAAELPAGQPASGQPVSRQTGAYGGTGN